MFKHLSFRARMACAFGLLTFLVLLVASVAWGSWTIHLLESQVRDELQARVHAASELIAEGLRDRSSEITDLSRMPDMLLNGAPEPDLQERLDAKRALKMEYAWLGVASTDGHVLAATRQMLVGKDVSQHDWFKFGKTSTWIGDVHEAVLLSRLMPRNQESEPLRFIDIAAPVRDTTGAIRGVLCAHVHWSWITRLAESILQADAESRQLRIYIMDRHGVTLYPFAETGATSLRLQANISNSVGELMWADGKRYVTGQAALRESENQHLGWRIVLRQPVDVAYAPLRAFVKEMAAITFIVALLAAWLAYWIASYLNTPIAILATAVDRLGGENAHVMIAAHLPPELQRLADAIQAASVNLTASRRDLLEANELLEQRVHERTRALALANEALTRQAMTDGLTRVANRRAFDQKLTEVHALSARTGVAYGLLVIDTDLFKRVNDQYGHQIGDSVLVAVAEQLVGSLRATDFVARYGGEEFVVLLYSVKTAEELLAVAEKLRCAIEQFTFDPVGRVTISLGGCLVQGASADLRQVIQLADGALYEAKRQGRNRCVIAASPTSW
ncbi:diguanylate cyclase [Duganella sp. LX20W]|uniref:diguanylate cyclase n=1 Tax=Rugamonas brunnea TaxID=2758569 RepID=A0A7W2IDS2_9BURK|nr:sensor domain-containing diguanylate cyclase [Rugamonas brunnea]MBA5639866.1 diguanylate cyclase [Rugamonas brunnea]